MAETAFEQPPSMPDDPKLGLLNSNKRKRDSTEVQQGRAAPTTDFSLNSSEGLLDADFNALTHHNNSDSGANGASNPRDVSDTATAALSAYNSLTVPQPTEITFQSQTGGADHGGSFGMGDQSPFLGLDKQSSGQGGNNASPTQSTQSNKPAVGSEEWHRVRRDNHKEVERRRRETINEGINELAKIVPGCEKNKGSILQRAVQFITQLKENERHNLEKWTLEKLLTEQAITELSASVDKIKADAAAAWHECDVYKRACAQAGIVPDEIRSRDAGADGADG